MCNIKGKALPIAILMLLITAVFAWGSDNPFLDAVQKGDVTVVKKIVKGKPAIVNAPIDEKGRAALHIAAWKNQKEVVALLLKAGADLEMKVSPAKATPLHYAAIGGDIEIVNMLLKKGANIESVDIDDETPLFYASQKGHLDVVKLLVEKGADLRNKYTEHYATPLRYAVSGGHLDVVKYLVSKGADVKMMTHNGFSLLHFAAWRGKPELIQFFLDAGLPVNIKSQSGRIPLHHAAWTGNQEVVELLLKQGADLNAVDSDNASALSLSSRNGHKETVARLLEAGAKGDFRDKDTRRNLLHFAALSGYGKIAKMMIDKGVDINAKDVYHYSPLQYAARYGHVKVAKLLVAAGAEKEGIEKKFAPSPLLEKKFEKGNAIVFYLGHSGWAVKTSGHLLIFDYFKRENRPDTPFLANGCINSEEIKKLKTVVFSSHSHGDHFMPEIFQWKKDGVDATYILGFESKEKEEYIYIGPRETKTVGQLEVTTIKSNDSGVGFFVKVDGVSIYHPGDHANRKNDFSEPFKEEIDFLAQKNLTPDLMFSPLVGCGATDQGSVKKGLYYTVKKIKPKAIFPMHAMGQEYRYKDFAKEVKEKGLDVPVLAAANCGDFFFYKGGEVKDYGLYSSAKIKKVKMKQCKTSQTKTRSCDSR